jgi:hypothetical protein
MFCLHTVKYTKNKRASTTDYKWEQIPEVKCHVVAFISDNPKQGEGQNSM